MNVVFNPSVKPVNNSYNYYNYKKSANSQKLQFTGAMPAQESKLFDWFGNKYQGVAKWLGKNFTSHFIDSKPIVYFADKLKNAKNLYQHVLTVGSAITSGMYMYRTLTNDKFDKDRKHTLAVNQGLTFVISTAMAYSLDNVLSVWWNKIMAKYVGYQLGDKDFYNNYVKENKEIRLENKKLKALKNPDIELKPLKDVKEAFKESSIYKNLLADEKQVIKNRVEGMKALKTMVIFGLIYRYFVPVVVTKPANFLSEKYLEHKKSKLNGTEKSDKKAV